MVSQSKKPGKSGSDPALDAHRRLSEADRLRQARQYGKALAICKSLLKQYPDYVGALHTAGLIHAEKREFSRALEYLVRAAMHHPRAWTTLTALSGVYLALGASEMAAEMLERAVKIKSDDPFVLATLGEIYREEREYELAVDAYRRALSLDPENSAAAVGLGVCAARIGLNEEAAASLRGAMAKGNFTVSTLHALARLPPRFGGLELLDELKKATRADNQTEAAFASLVAFTEAILLDRFGRHGAAWDRMCAANKTVYGKIRKEALRQRERERQSLTFAQAQPARIAPEDRSAPISLFILGPSRSGKTTLESLLAGLAALKRGYENPITGNAIRRTFQEAGFLNGGSYNGLSPGLEPLCRQTYLDELRRRAGAAKVFSNTAPGRMHDALGVAAVIPNVRFVLVKRNFDDTVFRIFQRRYSSGNAYAYDLGTIRDHVNWYHHMIDVIAAKLPTISCVAVYEAMVADPRSIVDLVAKLCGLPMPEGLPPACGDDRNCSAPYRELMERGLRSAGTEPATA